MTAKLGEETEISLSIKAIAGLIFFLASGCFYVFAIDERLDFLESAITTIRDSIATHSEHDSDDLILKIELLKKDVEHLTTQLNRLDENK